MQARVASLTACRLRAPLRTASTICAFVTALQSQIWAASGIRSAGGFQAGGYGEQEWSAASASCLNPGMLG